MRLRSGDKHQLRNSADRKAQIRKAFVPLTGLICAFRSAEFLRWGLSPERNLTHNLFFYFQYFLVLIDFLIVYMSTHSPPSITILQWNQAKMWLFLNNFSASTNWFWKFKTLLEQSLYCLLFPEWNRIGIFCGNGGKIALPPFGGLWGKRGSGKNHFSGRGLSRLARLASFCSITVPLVQFSNVWFFRQAHTRPTNLYDQFLEILTCWTRWQASFFIILKGKTSKPGQMSSSFRKIFEAEKNWQK